MRRVVVIASVLVVAGIAAWFLFRSGPATARDLADRSCSSLAVGLHSSGTAVRLEAQKAIEPSRQAAHKDRKYRRFAAVVSQLAASNSANGVGTPARPADLAIASQTCGAKVLDPKAAIATRVPYLTDATPNSVLVNFATDRAAPRAAVVFGPAGSNCRTSRATATAAGVPVQIGRRTDYLYNVELTNLRPRTTYCYRLGPEVFDLSTREVAPRFTTAQQPSDSTPFSFAVIGDWGGGTRDEAKIIKRIASSPASFIVTTGDNSYISGNQTDYGDLSGGHVFGPDLWPQVGGRLPTYAAQGNHGFSIYMPMLQNWPEPATVLASQGSYQRDAYCCTPNLARTHHYADTWYAFDRGPARFYILDGAWADHTGDYAGDFLAHWNGPVRGCPACGTELQWLQADLAAHASTPLKFAFFHYPLHVDASDHRSDTYLGGPGSLEGLLARNGVDVVFNGHAHLYERNTPQIPGSNMVSYVTGGGGVHNGADTLARVQGCSSYDAYAIGLDHTACNAPPPASDQQVFHYLLVTVEDRQVKVTPTDENGHPFDIQTYHF